MVSDSLLPGQPLCRIYIKTNAAQRFGYGKVQLEKDVYQKKIEAVGKVCKLAEDQKYTEGQKKKEKKKKVISLILDVAPNWFHEELL